MKDDAVDMRPMDEPDFDFTDWDFNLDALTQNIRVAFENTFAEHPPGAALRAKDDGVVVVVDLPLGAKPDRGPSWVAPLEELARTCEDKSAIAKELRALADRLEDEF